MIERSEKIHIEKVIKKKMLNVKMIKIHLVMYLEKWMGKEKKEVKSTKYTLDTCFNQIVG